MDKLKPLSYDQLHMSKDAAKLISDWTYEVADRMDYVFKNAVLASSLNPQKSTYHMGYLEGIKCAHNIVSRKAADSHACFEALQDILTELDARLGWDVV